MYVFSIVCILLFCVVRFVAPFFYFPSLTIFCIEYQVYSIPEILGPTYVEKRKISYFGLGRNLIQRLISPNQDDLSYSARTYISSFQNGWAAKPTLFGLRRRPEQMFLWSFLLSEAFKHSNTTSSNMDTQRGNHLIYGFFTRNPSWT